MLGISALVGGIGKLIAASGLRFIPDSALASGFIGKYLGYMGTNISPALLGVGLHRRPQHRRVVVSGSMLSFNIAIPIYHAYFLPENPELAATVAGACQGLSQRGLRGGHRADPARRADPLSRRRRDAGRRPVGADHACAIPSCRA